MLVCGYVYVCKGIFYACMYTCMRAYACVNVACEHLVEGRSCFRNDMNDMRK